MERAGDGSSDGVVVDGAVLAVGDGVRVVVSPFVVVAVGNAPVVHPTRRVRSISDAVAIPFDMSALPTTEPRAGRTRRIARPRPVSTLLALLLPRTLLVQTRVDRGRFPRSDNRAADSLVLCRVVSRVTCALGGPRLAQAAS
jgi:hypothetical protein